MPINASILTQIKTPQAPKTLQQIYDDQDKLAQAQAQRDKVIQQAKDDAAVRAAFGAHSTPDGGVDFDGLLSDLGGKISPSAYTALQKTIDDHREKASQTVERELKNRRAKLDISLGLSDFATDADTWGVVRPALIAADPDLANVLPEPWSDQIPALLQKAKGLGLTEKERQDQQFNTWKELQTLQRGTPEYLTKARTFLGQALSSESPEHLDSAIDAFMAAGIPKVVADQFRGKTPEQAAQMAIAPEKQAELDAQQIARDAQAKRDAETQRHNKAMEARPVAGSGAAAQGVTLSPDAVDYTAAQYRILGPSGIPTRLSDTEKIPIINRAAEQSKALGNSPAQAVQKQAAFKADAGALNQMRKMEASAESFETKANAQAKLISNLSAKVSRTSFPIINSALLAGKSDVAGDTDTQLFYNAVKTFASEYSKIIEGSTGSVAASSEGARRLAESLTPTKLSDGTFQATVKQMQWEMRQTMLGYAATIDHITDRMGGTAGAQTPGAGSATPSGSSSGVVDMVWDPKLGKYVRKGGG